MSARAPWPARGGGAARAPLPRPRLPPPTHHEPQHQRAHALPDLRGDVTAELLQGGEEAFQLAELPRPAGRGQVLRGQGGGGRGGRAIAEATGCGRRTVDGRRRVGAVHYCGKERRAEFGSRGRPGAGATPVPRGHRTPCTGVRTGRRVSGWGAGPGCDHEAGVALAQHHLWLHSGVGTPPQDPRAARPVSTVNRQRGFSTARDLLAPSPFPLEGGGPHLHHDGPERRPTAYTRPPCLG